MPSTMREIVTVLAELERQQFESIKGSFQLTEDWKRYLRGSIQSYAVNEPNVSEDAVSPVIVVVDVNYSQDGRSSDELFPYDRGGAGVVKRTQSLEGVRYVLAAYERNRRVWVGEEAKDPPSPMRFYGAPDATRKIGATANQEPLHLIMTNLCPFITTMQWAKQPKEVSRRLLEISNRYATIERLYDAIGSRVDLWIGHSAVFGTHWVWPTFSSFVQRNRIAEWLLTFNISPMSRLWFDVAFRKPENPRYPWYGPQKSTARLTKPRPRFIVNRGG